MAPRAVFFLFSAAPAAASFKNNIINLIKKFFFADKELQIGHKPSNALKDNRIPLVTWEPYFCVLLQDEQTLTAYRSEELSVSCHKILF